MYVVNNGVRNVVCGYVVDDVAGSVGSVMVIGAVLVMFTLPPLAVLLL